MERTTPTYNTQSKLEKRYDQHAAWFGDVCQNIISCDPSDSSSHQNQEKLTREILDSQQTKKIRRSLRSDVDRLKYANTLAIHIASAEDAPAEDPDLALQDSVVKAFLLQEHLSAVTGDDSLLSKVAKTNLDSLRGDESLRAAPNFDQVEQALEVMCQIHEASSDANNPEPQQANIVNNVVNLVEDNQESALAPRIKPVVLTSVVALALTAGASPAAAQEMRSDSTGNTSPASVDAAFSLDRTATVFVLGDETGDDVATTSQVPKTKLDHVESPAAKQDKPKDNPATSENHTKSPEPAELNTDEPDIQAPVTRLEQAEPAQPAEESEAAESADSLQQPAAEDTEAPKKTSPTTFFIDANPTPAPEVAAAAPAPSPAAEPAKPEPAAEPAPTPETTPSPEVVPEEVKVEAKPELDEPEPAQKAEEVEPETLKIERRANESEAEFNKRVDLETARLMAKMDGKTGRAGRVIEIMLQDSELNVVQSCGIVGNYDGESGLDPTIHQYHGGPGRGLAQWGNKDIPSYDRFGHGDRFGKVGLTKFAEERGKSWEDFDTQVYFTIYEFETTESRAYRLMKEADTPEEAAYIFEEHFERAGIPNVERRQESAKETCKQFNELRDKILAGEINIEKTSLVSPAESQDAAEVDSYDNYIDESLQAASVETVPEQESEDIISDLLAWKSEDDERIERDIRELTELNQ